MVLELKSPSWSRFSPDDEVADVEGGVGGVARPSIVPPVCTPEGHNEDCREVPLGSDILFEPISRRILSNLRGEVTSTLVCVSSHVVSVYRLSWLDL